MTAPVLHGGAPLTTEFPQSSFRNPAVPPFRTARSVEYHMARIMGDDMAHNGTMRRITNWRSIIIYALLALGAVACGGGGSDDASGSGTTATTEAEPSPFPTSLALASPLATSASPSASIGRKGLGKAITAYGSATDDIAAIINGTSAAACDFDASLFLVQDDDATCYGPEIDFENHPDWTAADPRYPTDDGRLPVGDLGIWQETDASGEACAAAELNERMDGISSKTNAALQSMASLICVANTNGLALPSSSTLTLTTEMNTMASGAGLGVTFNSASITHANATGRDQYTYALDFTYTSGATTYEITATLVHVAGCDSDGYQGRLSYAVNDTATMGNCTAGSPSADVTRAGSLLYRKYADTAYQVDARSAVFCAHNADAFTDGLVDPSKTYDAATNPDGWADDFNRFVANFDATNMAGQYAFAWQAGRGDGNTRVFNLTLTEDPTTTFMSGAAFFGFGDAITATDGSIDGFICNWAGPNGSHTLTTTAQAQYVSQTSAGGLFGSDSARLAIRYAPVNSCDYAGTGTLLYDTDDDGSLTDESATTVVTNNLVATTTIADSGFILPAAPANLDTTSCTSERLYLGTGEYEDSSYWDAVLRFDTADAIDSDATGTTTTPDGTIPVKSPTLVDGIQDAGGIQLNFVHSIYVWESRDEMFLGSLFTNASNLADGTQSDPSLQTGSIGVVSTASSATGSQTMPRHVYGSHIGGASGDIYQPHGIWIDETRQMLYSANSFDNQIVVFHSPSTADSVTNAALAPDRTISHTQLGAPIHVFVDETNDRLFVASVGASSTTACASGGQESIIAIYENASTVNGNVAPDIRLIGCETRLMSGNNQTTHNVWYNNANDMLIVGHHTNEVLFYDLSSVTSATQDWDLAPTRVLHIHEQADGSDAAYWSAYGLFYLPTKDRLYVAAGYNDPRPASLNGGAPDPGAPPNEIKIYDGVSLTHFAGLMTPTRTIHWDSASTYYPPQPLWVTEY